MLSKVPNKDVVVHVIAARVRMDMKVSDARRILENWGKVKCECALLQRRLRRGTVIHAKIENGITETSADPIIFLIKYTYSRTCCVFTARQVVGDSKLCANKHVEQKLENGHQ